MSTLDILKPKSKADFEDIVNGYLKEFVDDHLNEGFSWRPGQLNAIYEIVYTYIMKTHDTVILDAPVGSGKSLVAMAVSYVLNSMGKTGYILASDISLQDQYENDIKRMSLPWGTVKGVDNYICADNGEKHSLGSCKVRRKVAKTMHCYSICPYFKARDYAAKSSTSVLNYSYWLIMQNYTNGPGESFFPPRDFTICDEAHKVMDIVQSHFSPKFQKNTIDRVRKVVEFFNNHKVHDHTEHEIAISKSLDTLWATEDQHVMSTYLIIIEKALQSFVKTSEVLYEKVNKEYANKRPPAEWREALFICDWIKDLHCKVQDYNSIINTTSTRNIVKNPSGDELVFNCIEERYLMNRTFHRFAKFKILMSATFASPSDYMRNINVKSAKYVKVDNSFSFEKSPIYYYPKRRMSYRDFANNKQWLFDKVNRILDEHPLDSGIIHTASYDVAKSIKENLSPKNAKRVHVYKGTDEKRALLDMMKMSKGKVIMGPSLTTGLNMYDDYARFSIIAKVPYPSLGDRFVKAKLAMDQGWYNWKTVVEILQAIGRTVRHENDWAITYILDGSLGDLIHKSRKSFPKEFMDRIKIMADD